MSYSWLESGKGSWNPWAKTRKCNHCSSEEVVECGAEEAKVSFSGFLCNNEICLKKEITHGSCRTYGHGVYYEITSDTKSYACPRSNGRIEFGWTYNAPPYSHCFHVWNGRSSHPAEFRVMFSNKGREKYVRLSKFLKANPESEIKVSVCNTIRTYLIENPSKRHTADRMFLEACETNMTTPRVTIVYRDTLGELKMLVERLFEKVNQT